MNKIRRNVKNSSLQNCSKIALFSSLIFCLSFNTLKGQTMKTYVDGLAKPLMVENDISGLSIGITINGKHSFYNYGVLSKDAEAKVTNETLFELGSISKTFTASLASLSQIEGKLNLSDPVSKFMPELKNTVFDTVKLYNLGTHTAGGFTLQLPDEITNDKQLINYYKTWKPDYPVSKYRLYTNPGVGLLGVIAGRTMQQPFAEAMTKHIFVKMGLKNTFYKVPSEYLSKYAQGYNKTNDPVRLSPAILADEAYGIKSCTKDMITFVAANMGLGNVGKNLSQALMNTHIGYFKTMEMTQDLIWEQYNYPISLEYLQKGNSYDMIYKPNPTTEIVPHQKPESQVLINKTGSTNGFGGYVMYVPSKKIGIVILANKNYPNASRIEIAYKLLSYIEKTQ